MLSAHADTYLAQYAMAIALEQQQKYSEAVEHLHKAIELQPESAWAHYAMGICLMKTGDDKTAAVHLEIAVGRLPGSAGVRSLLAETNGRLGKK